MSLFPTLSKLPVVGFSVIYQYCQNHYLRVLHYCRYRLTITSLPIKWFNVAPTSASEYIAAQ